jgi:hypothetical protein
VVGVLALERMAHPRNPAAIVEKGSNVLQFLDGVRNWFSHR